MRFEFQILRKVRNPGNKFGPRYVYRAVAGGVESNWKNNPYEAVLSWAYLIGSDFFKFD